jgi:hypothetical protein
MVSGERINTRAVSSAIILGNSLEKETGYVALLTMQMLLSEISVFEALPSRA